MSKIIIIGGLSAGPSAAAKARREDENAEIILFEKGTLISYATCGMPYAFSGVIEDRNNLIVVKPELLQNRFNIDVRLNEEIVKIEPSCMLHPTIIGNYERNKQTALQQDGLIVKADFNDSVAVNHARQTIVTVEGETFLENTTLHQEVFGPFSMVVECKNSEELETIINHLEGQLTGTVLGEKEELEKYSSVIDALQNRVGRIIFNGVPTGVEVCPAMLHGGPYPSSTDSRFTAVGLHSVKRWVRPFSFQSWPNELLPAELKNNNPLGITRFVNGLNTSNKI